MGPGNCDITKQIDRDKEIRLFLTHSHSDHINGIKFFWKDNFKQIKEIIVPLCQNEIVLIAKAILNLKGLNSAVDCGEFINDLEKIVNGQIFLRQITNGMNGPMLSFAYDGQYYCGHLKCLNPPLSLESYNWLAEVEQEDINLVIDKLFSKGFAERLKGYFTYPNKYKYHEEPYFSEITLWETSERNEREITYDGRNFVLDFIMINLQYMQEFNDNPTRKRLRKVCSKFNEKVHDTCIVLRADYEESFLLTGDASKEVFRRLIDKREDITATYLKMPHHGSIQNMDVDILKTISPQKAIISHGNGKFGRAKDSHPNMEVLQMLQKENVDILLTNDVVKNDMVVMKKENHCEDLIVEMM